MVCERIAYDDVLAEEVADAVHTFLLHIVDIERMILVMENLEEPLTTGGGIVGQQLDAIDAADGKHRILFVFQLSVLALLHEAATHTQLPAENLRKEIAVATCRFQETAVDALRLVPNEVEHGIHLPFVGEHFAMLLHPFPRFYLFCLRCNHKKRMPNDSKQKPSYYHLAYRAGI